ncbi:helix-turn-helix transcriptional regulator [Muricauda lutimaris]|uniref:Helix-turn-helix transcriptional regulator n=2 Tax=Flagellimonas profundi TaxID=2915620 RepID=A0ABS3FK41_9FLAO|nr:helix-turn-helix transcriptional regulator [Allomuricauda profundi]
MDYKDFENCGLKKALDMLSGKWKPMILYFLFYQGEFRFNDLWRSIPRISKKVLMEHLQEMVGNDLVIRREVNGFPSEVRYALSRKGKALGPVLSALDEFGNTSNLN